MMNDRQRVELLFPLLLFKSIVTSSQVETDGNKAAVAYLDEGMWDVLRTAGDQRKQATVYRRVRRLHDDVLDPDRKGGLALEKAAMIAYYLLQSILAAGYLELEEGSKTAVAISAVIEAIGDGFAEERLDASAQKQAAKMLSELQEAGYFSGVEFQKEAA